MRCCAGQTRIIAGTDWHSVGDNGTTGAGTYGSRLLTREAAGDFGFEPESSLRFDLALGLGLLEFGFGFDLDLVLGLVLVEATRSGFAFG